MRQTERTREYENHRHRQPKRRGGKDHHCHTLDRVFGHHGSPGAGHRCRQPVQRHYHPAALALQGTGLAGALRQPPEEYRDLVQSTDIPFLDLIPATEALGDFELECTLGLAKPDFSLLRALVAALMEDDAYDNVVIDCPPYYSVSCISAVSACDSIVIPVGVDAYSTVGMAALVRRLTTSAGPAPMCRWRAA